MMNNINQGEIGDLQVPLPPQQVQKQIMKGIADHLSRAVELRVAADEEIKLAKQDVEQLIIGTRRL